MKQMKLSLAALALCTSIIPAALADGPWRVRELSCSDGTTFIGEQVRMGGGRPPHMFRNVDPGGDPAAFVFLRAAVTAPDGTIVEDVTWDSSDGVALNHELVTCSFVIPIGPLTGYQADFEGFFVPATDSIR